MNSTTIDEIAKAIANELDARERWILAWIERQVSAPYCDVSGETLDALLARGLVEVHATNQPKAYWPVICSELGCGVLNHLRNIEPLMGERA